MIEVRDATEKDAERILEIYDYYVRNTAITFEYDTPSLEEFRERMEKIMRKYPYLVILQDGEITERGTHEELLKHRGYYWETFCLQNGIDLASEVGHLPDERQPMQALAERSPLQSEGLERAEAKEAK